MPIQKISREDILLKSQDLFRRQGYYHTSMNELAEACGLHKGSFYHHFASKEALMIEILENIHTFQKTKIFNIAYDETLPPSERLGKMLAKFGKTMLLPEGGCFIGNTTLETAQHNPEFAKILRGVFEDWIKALQHLFSTQYPSDTALRLAQQTVMEFEGAVMLKKLFNDDNLLLEVYTRTMAKLH